MSAGPDVAGILTALSRLPGRTPEQRRAYRHAAATARTASAMRNGRRYRTRSLPRTSAPLPRWQRQPRDPATGRWIRAA